MEWIKWILAYVFHCFHRHTTGPHYDRRGFDYFAVGEPRCGLCFECRLALL